MFYISTNICSSKTNILWSYELDGKSRNYNFNLKTYEENTGNGY